MIINLNQVSKKYGKFKALKDVDLELKSGITALLGPNGAGKSTLIKIITGVLKMSTGKVMIDGKQVNTFSEKYLSNIGYVPQDFAFYDTFTVKQYLSYIGTLKGINKGELKREVEEAVEMVNLTDNLNKPIKELSGGMKRRVMIAQSVLSDPKILILDEPTAGLDPEERIRIRNIISKMSGNRTVLIATHIVADIERIAGQIVLIKAGEIICKKTPTELMDQINGKIYEGIVDESEYMKMQKSHTVSQIRNGENGKYYIRFISEVDPKGSFSKVYPSLEEVYLYTMRGKDD